MKRTCIGLGLELGFGLLPFACFFLSMFLEPNPPYGTHLREGFVTGASGSVAIFTLTAVGLALFWAVRDMRLHRAWAALLFLAAASVSLFVPSLLMHASRLFWPDNFHGDSGWILLMMPLCMTVFAVPAVIAFAISLVFARWHSRVAPFPQSAGGRGSEVWLVRGSLLGGAAVIVSALLASAFLETTFRLAHPADPGGHIKLGTAAQEQGNLDEAIGQYRKSLEVRPDSAEANNNLGLALAGRGEVDKAIARFRMALELNPHYAEAHYNLGNVLAGRGQIDEAIAHFKKALEIKPDYAEARRSLDQAREKGNVPK